MIANKYWQRFLPAVEMVNVMKFFCASGGRRADYLQVSQRLSKISSVGATNHPVCLIGRTA